MAMAFLAVSETIETNTSGMLDVLLTARRKKKPRLKKLSLFKAAQKTDLKITQGHSKYN